MSKIRSNLPNFSTTSLAKPLQATTSSSKKSQTSNQQASNNQAVLSFNANQPTTSSSSFDKSGASNLTKQKEVGLAVGQNQQQVKKKRTALENISNANSGASGANNTSSTNTNKEITKKSRFGNSAFGLNPLNLQPSNVTTESNNATKKSDPPPASKKSAKISTSKENLQFIMPLKKSEENVTQNPSKTLKSSATILSNGTNIPVLVNNKSLSAGSSVNVKSIDAVKSSEKLQDLNIERQLASATLSSKDELKTETFKSFLQELEEVSSTKQLLAENVTGWDDIDADDLDEFSANNYVEFIFKYYREREAKFRTDDYIKRQPNINKQMRLLLVDWMVEVQQQLEFNHEVLYLSVKLLDLYLNSRRIEKEKLQLLGGAAMFIACKFEERMPPIIDDFIYVSDNAYDRDELIKMEIEILKTVKFDIGVPLSYTFLRRYSKCIKADMKFLTLARYILELSLQDYNFSYLQDSLKACASLYLALKMTVSYEKNFKLMNGNDDNQIAVSTANLTATEWNSTLIHYTGSFLKDFIDYVPLMNTLVKTASSSKYKTIFTKYSHQVFYEVAKILPLSDIELTEVIENCEKSHQIILKS